MAEHWHIRHGSGRGKTVGGWECKWKTCQARQCRASEQPLDHGERPCEDSRTLELLILRVHNFLRTKTSNSKALLIDNFFPHMVTNICGCSCPRWPQTSNSYKCATVTGVGSLDFSSAFPHGGFGAPSKRWLFPVSQMGQPKAGGSLWHGQLLSSMCHRAPYVLELLCSWIELK